jgi:hypothetical protein
MAFPPAHDRSRVACRVFKADEMQDAVDDVQ